MKPQISIIVNCFNGSKYLSECLQSVKSQEYKNYELIFWDNCSTDNSKEIFFKHKINRFKYFKSKKKTNLSKARNLAIKKSSGKWLAFIDCDDVWYPKKLSKFKKFFDVENLGVLFSDYYILKKKIIKSKKKITNNFFKNLLKENYIFFSTVLIRRKFFFNSGMCDEKLNHAEDYDILLKILRKYEGYFINKRLIKYRIHGNNQSKHYKIESILESIYLLKKYRKYLEAKIGIMKLIMILIYHSILIQWKKIF